MPSLGHRRRFAICGTCTLFGAAALAIYVGSSVLAFASRALLPAASHRPLRKEGVSRKAVEASSTAATDAKVKLMDFISDATIAQEVMLPEGKPMRGQLDEMITVLERSNTCDEPSYSEMLDGTWDVKYSGSYAPGLLSSPTRELALFLYGGGFSLGSALSSFVEGFWGKSLGLTLNSKRLQITAGRDVQASADVTVGGNKERLSYTAELFPLSARRLSEEVLSFDLPPPLGKQDVPFELRRSILITYLDDSLMIVRDESGVPEVLVREGSASETPTEMPEVTPEKTMEANPEVTSGTPELDVGQDPMSSDAA
eukprot:CAMPEP_0172668068 /NCGR_PEP_ID=MMETSP1074-20121228/8832_1 /TAXON_ID=2916 /ORGANISM="Ceratium fusus, Strain PA161109" /LENGTH=312 /DNA_ID=CAMNT_0013484669 /DNA_START=47 /DNA_END=985 /DNA_ORIENTATION=+